MRGDIWIAAALDREAAPLTRWRTREKKAKLTLWVDTSAEADAEAAMALLSQQTVEEKTGKPRKSEDGFLGSALLGSSFPTAAAAMEVVEEEEDPKAVM